MTTPAISLPTTGHAPKSGPTDFARALLNILDDFASEQNQLRAMQNAVLNVLEDSASETGRFQDTQRAMLNTLEDFAEEKSHLEGMKSAVLNILEDLGSERDKLEEAQKQLATANEELTDSTVRLEQSNRELQDFASVASHDLQEPLRKVQAFGDRLLTEYGAAMGEQGQDYLDRMLKATKRMQSLIRDLLTFSRIGSKGRSFLPVDLAQVTREVLSDLEVRIAETNAVVEVGDLPTIDADAMLYMETADFEPNTDGMFRLAVEDQGIGFEEKYLDRIFTVFQRLHSRAEYEGTGVGLAVCRKIAQRHGGDITATSIPGQGAKFLVTLPSSHANENSARIPVARADMPLSMLNAASATNSSLTSAEGET